MCDRCGSYYAWSISNWYEGDNRPGNWEPKFKEEVRINNHAFVYGKKGGVKSAGGIKHFEIKKVEQDIRNSPEIDYATYTYKYGGKWYEKDMISGERRLFVSPYDEEYLKEE